MIFNIHVDIYIQLKNISNCVITQLALLFSL
jgi:hypothetical protein